MRRRKEKNAPVAPLSPRRSTGTTSNKLVRGEGDHETRRENLSLRRDMRHHEGIVAGQALDRALDRTNERRGSHFRDFSSSNAEYLRHRVSRTEGGGRHNRNDRQTNKRECQGRRFVLAVKGDDVSSKGRQSYGPAGPESNGPPKGKGQERPEVRRGDRDLRNVVGGRLATGLDKVGNAALTAKLDTLAGHDGSDENGGLQNEEEERNVLSIAEISPSAIYSLGDALLDMATRLAHPTRERVLRRRYFVGDVVDLFASIFGTGLEDVGQVLKRALGTLRQLRGESRRGRAAA